MGKTAWHIKNIVRHAPGVYPLWKWLVSRQGIKHHRIPFGELKGMRWFTAPGLPYWYRLGLYEPHVSQLIAANLRHDGVLWDVGANAGYHSLLGAKIARYVVSVEADPEMARLIERQRVINGLNNWSVEAVAISDSEGTTDFVRASNPLQSGLAGVGTEGQTFLVPSRTLDSLLHAHPAPTVVKIDIEGAEALALAGAEQLLDHGPVMLVSIHAEHRAACEEILHEAGYSINVQAGFEQMLIAKRS